MKIFPRSRRDLGRDRGRDLGAFFAAEIFISPRSRRVFGRRVFYLAAISAEISPLISARFWPPRFSSRRDLGQKRAEISGEMKISATKNAPRSRQISAAKNAPRLVARSRQDENLGGQKRAEISPNLGGQKRAEISGEISAR